jgi:starch synthase
MTLHVLAVTPEVFPLVKTGGLADVAGALPLALAAFGVETRTLVPAYPAVHAALPEAREVAPLPDVLGASGRLLAGRTASGLDLLLLDLPAFFARPGNPYVGPDARDWPDNAFRFASLARTAALLGRGLLPDWRPQVVHAHDWQAGLAPAYLALAGGARPATVQTIHNLAFQGQFDPGLVEPLGLPRAAFGIAGLEYYGALGFLKAGLYYADRLTTVSPTYAREIQTAALGMGMHGLLQGRAASLTGIVNGLDTVVWDPATDHHLPARYDVAEQAGKAVCKAELQRRLGLLPDPEALVFAVVSRLTHQKGLDLVLGALPDILGRGGELALLGSGEPDLEHGFRHAARAHPGRVGCHFGYDEPLSHLIQAGADAILVPSRFEPCGLTQLIGLRYGTLPVVARVGGLADTVIDASPAALMDGVATGFQFAPVTAEALRDALLRAFELWADRPAWTAVRRRAMTREVGWAASARRYAALYRELADTTAAPPMAPRRATG